MVKVAKKTAPQEDKKNLGQLLPQSLDEDINQLETPIKQMVENNELYKEPQKIETPKKIEPNAEPQIEKLVEPQKIETPKKIEPNIESQKIETPNEVINLKELNNLIYNNFRSIIKNELNSLLEDKLSTYFDNYSKQSVSFIQEEINSIKKEGFNGLIPAFENLYNRVISLDAKLTESLITLHKTMLDYFSENYNDFKEYEELDLEKKIVEYTASPPTYEFIKILQNEELIKKIEVISNKKGTTINEIIPNNQLDISEGEIIFKKESTVGKIVEYLNAVLSTYKRDEIKIIKKETKDNKGTVIKTQLSVNSEDLIDGYLKCLSLLVYKKL